MEAIRALLVASAAPRQRTDNQPDPGTDRHRARTPARPARPSDARLVANLPHCAPRPGDAPANRPGWPCAPGPAPPGPDRQINTLDTLVIPLVTARQPRAAAGLRRRPPDRRHAAGRRRRQPAAHPHRGRLGQALRRGPAPRLLRPDHPPPPQPRRQPPSQQRPVPHRDHPPGSHPPTQAYVATAHRTRTCPKKKPSAASSATSPARSIPTCARPRLTPAPGGGLTR